MDLVLLGLNHRTASLELRERAAFSPEQAQRAAGELRSRGILAETLVLSTCNRSELYGVPAGPPEESAGAMESYLTAFHQLTPAEFNGCLYRHHGSDVVRHLFRVAAGLDSMLLGEAEILGQVREAYRSAFDNGSTGPLLNRMFQAALEVGKRVRTETEIGTRPVSVAFAGVKLAERIFGKLQGHQALLLGAGSVGEQVADHLHKRGIARLRVANRTPQRGEDLAAKMGGSAVAWEETGAALESSDVVVSSVSGAERVVSRAMIERAMQARGNRVMFLIDLGVPRNIEPEAGKLYNVYLYNVDDLSEIVEQNRKAREDEIPRVEAIIAEHVAKFEGWQASVEVTAVLQELRGKLDREREALVRERVGEMSHLSAEDRDRLLQLTEELFHRLLFSRVERLRSSKELRQRLRDLEALRELFDLDRPKP